MDSSQDRSIQEYLLRGASGDELKEMIYRQAERVGQLEERIQEITLAWHIGDQHPDVELCPEPMCVVNRAALVGER